MVGALTCEEIRFLPDRMCVTTIYSTQERICMTKEELRERVNSKIANVDKFPRDAVLFWNSDKEREAKILRAKDRSVEELVMAALKLTLKYDSRRVSDGLLLCSRGRRRSAWDLYMHVHRFREDVTLFQVMSAIFSLQDELRIQICSMIHRRVIRLPLEENREGPTLLHSSKEDEFGISFRWWNEIHTDTGFVAIELRDSDEFDEDEYDNGED